MFTNLSVAIPCPALHSSSLLYIILLLCIPKAFMTDLHASFHLRILERSPQFLPSTYAHRVEAKEYKIYCQLDCCSLGAIKNEDKRTSNHSAICHLVILGCFSICLKTSPVVMFLYIGINKSLLHLEIKLHRMEIRKACFNNNPNCSSKSDI